jgi:DNA polymerase III delta prime subunit
MKFYETTFPEYIQSAEQCPFHDVSRFSEFHSQVPAQLPHIIFYGPAGIGKYTQCLLFLKHYSLNQLRHEKKVEFEMDKKTSSSSNTKTKMYGYKMSDIHYEIDMSLLGCNAKTIWNECMNRIVDNVLGHPNKTGFVVCKNFHMVNNELLELLYGYMTQYPSISVSIHLRFIFITECVSFISNNILQMCHVFEYGRPTNPNYLSFVSPAAPPPSNLKEVRMNLRPSPAESSIRMLEKICQPIVDDIQKIETLNLSNFREKIYLILEYNLDLNECIWFILEQLFCQTNEEANPQIMSEAIQQFFGILKKYNNNYRSIYHIESILLQILLKYHDSRTTPHDIRESMPIVGNSSKQKKEPCSELRGIRLGTVQKAVPKVSARKSSRQK